MSEVGKFHDHYVHTRFWSGLNHSSLPEILRKHFRSIEVSEMTLIVALSIAESCRCTELMPELTSLLHDENRDQTIRERAMEAICACLDSDNVHIIEAIAKGETGLDPDSSLLGDAFIALVPKYWSVSKCLDYITPPRNANYYGSYSRSLSEHLPKHVTDEDLKAGMNWILKVYKNVTSTSHNSQLYIKFLLLGLDSMDEKGINQQLADLWLGISACHSHSILEILKPDVHSNHFVYEPSFTEEKRLKWVQLILSCESDSEEKTALRLIGGSGKLLHSKNLPWLFAQLKDLQKRHDTTAKVVSYLFNQDE